MLEQPELNGCKDSTIYGEHLAIDKILEHYNKHVYWLEQLRLVEGYNHDSKVKSTVRF